jgi:hypothetical protein
LWVIAIDVARLHTRIHVAKYMQMHKTAFVEEEQGGRTLAQTELLFSPGAQV